MKTGPFKMKYKKSSFPFKGSEGKQASEKLENFKISEESYKSNKKRAKEQGQPNLDFDDFLREKGFTEPGINIINEGKMQTFKKDRQAISDTIKAYEYQNRPKIK